MDYKYLRDHYQVICCDLIKQQQLDADPRSIEQFELSYMLDTNSHVCTVLEKSKEIILEFYKGHIKIL